MWKVLGTVISAVVLVYVLVAAGFVFYAYVLNPMFNF